MAIRLCTDSILVKYKYGKWLWNCETEEFDFHNISDKVEPPDYAIPAPKLKFGIKFKDYMDQLEEMKFRNKFARPIRTNDSNFITIQDIKDVVIFSAPTGSFSKKFIDFCHRDTINEFLHCLIIYFQYFLTYCQFMLQRTNECVNNGKVRDNYSEQIDEMLADYLCQYRVLLAREYSKMLQGDKDVYVFHHLSNGMKKSATEKDLLLYETFICFCTRMVWVTMHRRGYAIIDIEMNRLMRTRHFNVARRQLESGIGYTTEEKRVLYGPNNIHRNYQTQCSPLVLELININPKNLDVLNIGVYKYKGKNPRFQRLELEYTLPVAHLVFYDMKHGILGHPKAFYNTMLHTDWYTIRQQKFTNDNDPYQFLRPANIYIPDWNEYQKHYEKMSKPTVKICKMKCTEYETRQRKLWKNRENVLKSMEHFRIEHENLYYKCEKEIEKYDGQPIEIDRQKIVDEYLKIKNKFVEEEEIN